MKEKVIANVSRLKEKMKEIQATLQRLRASLQSIKKQNPDTNWDDNNQGNNSQMH